MLQYRRFSRRERTIVAVTLSVALLASFYVFVAEPVALKWLTVSRRAQAAEEELRYLQELVKDRDTIERDFKRLQNALTTGASEQAVKVDLLSEVDELARRCGLAVSSVKPTIVVREGAFHRYGMEVQVHCEAHEFLKLLQAMQSPEHLFHADTLSLAVGPVRPPLTITLKVSKLAKIEMEAP